MSPFRNATELVEAEVAVLEAAHHRALASTPTCHRSLFVRRTARIAAGVAATVVAAVLVVAMMTTTAGYARLLLAGWGVVLIAYAVAAAAASLVLQRRLRRAMMRTGDPFRDHAALRVADLPGLERELAGRRIHASYAWPLVAITLLGPPTLHLLVGLGLGASYHKLDEWLRFTCRLSPHIFGYAIVVAWRYPRTRRVWRHVLCATVLSLFPGVLFLGISTLIVFFSAAIIALVGYLPMDALMAREA
jgi:hypothetical protein